MHLEKVGNRFRIVYGRGKSKSLAAQMKNPSDRQEANELFENIKRAKEEQKILILRAKQERRLSIAKKEFIEYKTPRQKPSTLSNYHTAINHLIDFLGDIDMEMITPQSLNAFNVYLMRKNISKRSIFDYRTAITPFFKWATFQKPKYMTVDPSTMLQEDGKTKQWEILPHDSKPKPIIETTQDISRWLEASQKFDGLKYAVPIQLYTAWGRAEVMGTIAFTEENLTCVRVKTDRDYRVPLHPRLRPFIETFIGTATRVVPWRNKRTYNAKFKSLATYLGMPQITPHCLRHTYGASIVKAMVERDGMVDWEVIRNLFGHKDDKLVRSTYSRYEKQDGMKQAINFLPY